MPSIPFPAKSLHLLCGVLIALVAQINLVALLTSGFSLSVSLTDALTHTLLLTFVTVTLIRIFKFYTPSLAVFWFCLGLAATGGLLVPIAAQLALKAMVSNNPMYTSFLQSTMQVKIGIGMLTCSSNYLAITLFNQLQREIVDKKQEQQIQQLATEAELFKLRQQLQPHFLFNSLNSINALIGVRPQEARHMTEQLASFLRDTIQQREDKLVPLKEEMDQVNRYLQIERLRFGHRLQVNISMQDEHHSALIPPLLLQPLVENAIKFGLYETTGEVLIEIRVEIQNNQLQVSIQNPIDPEQVTQHKGTGFGLSSVQRRLLLLFGRSDLLQVKRQTNIFTTTVIIPQVYADRIDH